MKLKQLLKVTDKEQRMHVQVYAYGVLYASTLFDGLKTCEDIRKNVRQDILDATVTTITTTVSEEENGQVFSFLRVFVELCK